ncbi:MAG TPA: prolyl oligopeptidase family serine peptidase [Polyangiaceae bacterium]
MVLPGASAAQMPVLHSAGRYAAYLRIQDHADVMDLRLLDRSSGSDTLLLSGTSVDQSRGPMSLDEELARERARERCTGVGSVQWLPKSTTLFSVASNRLLLIDAENGSLVEYVHHASIASAELNGAGDRIVFASGHNLWGIRIVAGKFADCVQLTQDGSAELLHGTPDQITREEVFNGSAFSWSRSGASLVYASFDVAQVESISISNGLQTRAEIARYGRPGENVASFALSVLDLASGQSRPLFPRTEQWPYFVGMLSRKSGDLVLVRLDRSQRSLQLVAIDVEKGASRVLLEKTGQPWINVIDRPHFRALDNTLFWIHEPEGLGRIGMYDSEGRWLRDLGEDAGHVEGVVSLEPGGTGVYFLATGADPRERHLYFASPATDWKSQRITTEPGTHGGRLAENGKTWCRVRDSIDEPPRMWIEEAGGSVSFQFSPAAERGIEANFVKPRLVEAWAADGATKLYGALYEAETEPAARSRPVVLLVYGGPHVQSVRNAWALAADLRAQLLVQHGFVVLKCDNRGTSGRGIAFEKSIYGRLGTLEVADQCAFLEQILLQRPELDRKRIGVCGWSYGGYLALRCAQGRPDLFAAAVAGAPVVRWEDYDAPYTERYMGSPTPSPYFASDNAAGYRASSALSNIGAFQGKLLIVHGMNDENVLLRHSALLVNDLIARGMLFDTLFLPSERHSVRAPAQRRYLEQRILGFLKAALADHS